MSSDQGNPARSLTAVVRWDIQPSSMAAMLGMYSDKPINNYKSRVGLLCEYVISVYGTSTFLAGRGKEQRTNHVI